MSTTHSGPALPRRDATHNPPEVLSSLFDRLAAYSDPIPMDELRRELEHITVTADELGDSIHIDTGAYVRTLVFERDHAQVLVMAWLPGQRSPIHDHAGSACAVRIVSGRAREQLYRLRDDGHVEKTESRHLEPGSVTCSFDADIHTLGNAADCPAPPSAILITLHAYSPPLAPTRKYTEG